MLSKLTRFGSTFLKCSPKFTDLSSSRLNVSRFSFNYSPIFSTTNLNRFYSSGNISKEMEASSTPVKSVPGIEVKADGAMVELNRKDIPLPAPIDIPHHPEILTVEHVDHAIEVYQDEFLKITCNYVEIVSSVSEPKNPNDMYDDTDWQKWFYRKRRYRITELVKNHELRAKIKDIANQKFNPKRTGILGPDLAASHFITYRGGRVKFVGSDKWVSTDIVLPQKMDSAFKVEKLDGSSCRLQYEGLDNFINLKQLVHLDLADNPLDDWACGRLACHFRNSTKLKYLNLSDNKNITAIGLQSLVAIPTLETIVITGTKAADYPHLELLIMLMQDVNPRCKIEL